jgi:hypothetical protein
LRSRLVVAAMEITANWSVTAERQREQFMSDAAILPE